MKMIKIKLKAGNGKRVIPFGGQNYVASDKFETTVPEGVAERLGDIIETPKAEPKTKTETKPKEVK